MIEIIILIVGIFVLSGILWHSIFYQKEKKLLNRLQQMLDCAIDGEPIELSKTEQKLLKVLCENRGKVVKREYLIDEVWQGETEFVDAHALTVAVKRLRDKLEDDTQKPEYVKTVYGIGYTWAVNG